MTTNPTTRAIQAIQEEFAHLRSPYPEDTLQFQALTLAHEAARCARLACERAEHNLLWNVADAVSDALSDVHDMIEAGDTTPGVARTPEPEEAEPGEPCIITPTQLAAHNHLIRVARETLNELDHGDHINPGQNMREPLRAALKECEGEAVP